MNRISNYATSLIMMFALVLGGDHVAAKSPEIKQRRAAMTDTLPPCNTLHQDYDRLQIQAIRLARQCREPARGSERSAGASEARKERLRDIVRQAFETRQKLQHAERNRLRLSAPVALCETRLLVRT